jgi:hypothetical protein
MTSSKGPAIVLLAVGLLQLGLRGLFIVLSQTMPIVRGGFLPTAAILGIAGVALVLWGTAWWKRASNALRLRAEGIAGQARITGQRQTGAYINSQPQVELRLHVTTPMHGGYEVTRKEIVPLIMLGQHTSGKPLPVKADPNNPQDLVIEWESALRIPAGA